jgi:large subunit ribosomal protein L34e
MVRPAQRSRTFRRVKVRTPGGKTVTHYRLKKPAKAKCSSCKGELHGMARGRPAAMKKLTKSQKRPERPYAGQLCSKCLRKKIVVELTE